MMCDKDYKEMNETSLELLNKDEGTRMSSLDLYEDLLVQENQESSSRILTIQEVITEKRDLAEQNKVLLQQLVEKSQQLHKVLEEKSVLQKNFDTLLSTAKLEIARKNNLLKHYTNRPFRKPAPPPPVTTNTRNTQQQERNRTKKITSSLKGKRINDEETRQPNFSKSNESSKNRPSASSTLRPHRGERMVGVATRVVGCSFEKVATCSQGTEIQRKQTEVSPTVHPMKTGVKGGVTGNSETDGLQRQVGNVEVTPVVHRGGCQLGGGETARRADSGDTGALQRSHAQSRNTKLSNYENQTSLSQSVPLKRQEKNEAVAATQENKAESMNSRESSHSIKLQMDKSIPVQAANSIQTKNSKLTVLPNTKEFSQDLHTRTLQRSVSTHTNTKREDGIAFKSNATERSSGNSDEVRSKPSKSLSSNTKGDSRSKVGSISDLLQTGERSKTADKEVSAIAIDSLRMKSDKQPLVSHETTAKMGHTIPSTTAATNMTQKLWSNAKDSRCKTTNDSSLFTKRRTASQEVLAFNALQKQTHNDPGRQVSRRNSTNSSLPLQNTPDSKITPTRGRSRSHKEPSTVKIEDKKNKRGKEEKTEALSKTELENESSAGRKTKQKEEKRDSGLVKTEGVEIKKESSMGPGNENLTKKTCVNEKKDLNPHFHINRDLENDLQLVVSEKLIDIIGHSNEIEPETQTNIQSVERLEDAATTLVKDTGKNFDIEVLENSNNNTERTCDGRSAKEGKEHCEILAGSRDNISRVLVNHLDFVVPDIQHNSVKNNLDSVVPRKPCNSGPDTGLETPAKPSSTIISKLNLDSVVPLPHDMKNSIDGKQNDWTESLKCRERLGSCSPFEFKVHSDEIKRSIPAQRMTKFRIQYNEKVTNNAETGESSKVKDHASTNHVAGASAVIRSLEGDFGSNEGEINEGKMMEIHKENLFSRSRAASRGFDDESESNEVELNEGKMVEMKSGFHRELGENSKISNEIKEMETKIMAETSTTLRRSPRKRKKSQDEGVEPKRKAKKKDAAKKTCPGEQKDSASSGNRKKSDVDVKKYNTRSRDGNKLDEHKIKDVKIDPVTEKKKKKKWQHSKNKVVKEEEKQHPENEHLKINSDRIGVKQKKEKQHPDIDMGQEEEEYMKIISGRRIGNKQDKQHPKNSENQEERRQHHKYEVNQEDVRQHPRSLVEEKRQETAMIPGKQKDEDLDLVARNLSKSNAERDVPVATAMMDVAMEVIVETSLTESPVVRRTGCEEQKSLDARPKENRKKVNKKKRREKEERKKKRRSSLKVKVEKKKDLQSKKEFESKDVARQSQNFSCDGKDMNGDLKSAESMVGCKPQREFETKRLAGDSQNSSLERKYLNRDSKSAENKSKVGIELRSGKEFESEDVLGNSSRFFCEENRSRIWEHKRNPSKEKEAQESDLESKKLIQKEDVLEDSTKYSADRKRKTDEKCHPGSDGLLAPPPMLNMWLSSGNKNNKNARELTKEKANLDTDPGNLRKSEHPEGAFVPLLSSNDDLSSSVLAVNPRGGKAKDSLSRSNLTSRNQRRARAEDPASGSHLTSRSMEEEVQNDRVTSKITNTTVQSSKLQDSHPIPGYMSKANMQSRSKVQRLGVNINNFQENIASGSSGTKVISSRSEKPFASSEKANNSKDNVRHSTEYLTEPSLFPRTNHLNNIEYATRSYRNAALQCLIHLANMKIKDLKLRDSDVVEPLDLSLSHDRKYHSQDGSRGTSFPAEKPLMKKVSRVLDDPVSQKPKMAMGKIPVLNGSQVEQRSCIGNIMKCNKILNYNQRDVQEHLEKNEYKVEYGGFKAHTTSTFSNIQNSNQDSEQQSQTMTYRNLRRRFASPDIQQDKYEPRANARNENAEKHSHVRQERCFIDSPEDDLEDELEDDYQGDKQHCSSVKRIQPHSKSGRLRHCDSDKYGKGGEHPKCEINQEEGRQHPKYKVNQEYVKETYVKTSSNIQRYENDTRNIKSEMYGRESGGKTLSNTHGRCENSATKMKNSSQSKKHLNKKDKTSKRMEEASKSCEAHARKYNKDHFSKRHYHERNNDTPDGSVGNRASFFRGHLSRSRSRERSRLSVNDSSCGYVDNRASSSRGHLLRSRSRERSRLSVNDSSCGYVDNRASSSRGHHSRSCSGERSRLSAGKSKRNNPSVTWERQCPASVQRQRPCSEERRCSCGKSLQIHDSESFESRALASGVNRRWGGTQCSRLNCSGGREKISIGNEGRENLKMARRKMWRERYNDDQTLRTERRNVPSAIYKDHPDDKDWDHMLRQHMKTQQLQEGTTGQDHNMTLEDRNRVNLTLVPHENQHVSYRKPHRVTLESVAGESAREKEAARNENQENNIVSPPSLSRSVWISSLQDCQERRKKRARWSSEQSDISPENQQSNIHTMMTSSSTEKTRSGKSFDHEDGCHGIENAKKCRNENLLSTSDVIPEMSMISSSSCMSSLTWQLSEESRCRFNSIAKSIQQLSPLKASPLKLNPRPR